MGFFDDSVRDVKKKESFFDDSRRDFEERRKEFFDDFHKDSIFNDKKRESAFDDLRRIRSTPTLSPAPDTAVFLTRTGPPSLTPGRGRGRAACLRSRAGCPEWSTKTIFIKY